jgi:hypothetical protein
MQGKDVAAGVYAVLVALAGRIVLLQVAVAVYLVHALDRSGNKTGEDWPRQARDRCEHGGKRKPRRAPEICVGGSPCLRPPNKDESFDLCARPRHSLQERKERSRGTLEHVRAVEAKVRLNVL